MQRLKQVFGGKPKEDTNVSINGHYHVKGVTWEGTGYGHDCSPYGAYDSIKSSRDVRTAFYRLVLECKNELKEDNLKEVTERSAKFTVKGKIKGVEVDKEVHSLVGLARVLRDYGVDTGYLQLARQDSADDLVKLKEGKPSNVTELHLHGLLNGKKVEDQDLHNTAEIVSFLNAHVKGVKYRAVTENECILTASELEEKLAKSRLQGRQEGVLTALFISMAGEQEGSEEQVVTKSVDENDQPRVVDITDGDPEAMETEARMKL